MTRRSGSARALPIALAVFSFLTAAGLLRAQVETIALAPPRVDVIDFYGQRQVSRSLLQQALGTREGGPLPPSRGEAERRINQIDRVVATQLEAVVEDGLTILYVGIEERGAPHFPIREAPGGPQVLPPAILTSYEEFLSASRAAAARGSTAEDLTNGHSLLADPESRRIQQTFPAIAEENLELLQEVLRESSDDPSRIAAAYIIGYYPDKAAVVDDLQYALRDANPSVRANAISSITAMVVLSRLHPETGLRISATWFIEMLNSISWSDRNRALWAMQLLTEERDDTVIRQLQTRAMDALVEMAGWKTLRHALPAFILVGRVGGLPEQEIQDAFARGERQEVIESVLKNLGR